MTQQKQPRLQIPVSQSAMDLQVVQIEMLQDKPFCLRDKMPDIKYDTWYYSVRDLSDNMTKDLTAYTGLYNTLEDTMYGVGAVLAVARVGEGTETRYTAKLISGPTRSSAVVTSQPSFSNSQSPSPVQATQQRATHMVWTPLTNEEKNVKLTIANHHIDMLESVMALVSVRESFDDLTPDQIARIATGALIQADRTYRPGMVIAGSESDSVSHRLEVAVGGKVGDEKTQAFINFIMSEVGSSVLTSKDSVISLLIRFSFSGKDITAADNDELLTIVNACAEFVDAMLLPYGTNSDGEQQEDFIIEGIINEYGFGIPAF